MIPVCKVCRHPEVAKINLALLNGGAIRVVAKQFGYEDHTVMHRHKSKHLPNVLAKVALETEVQVRSELQPEIDTILNVLMTLYQQMCVDCRHHVLAAIEALERHVDEPVA